MSHGQQPEVEYFPFWRVFAPHNGREKLLLEVCGLMLQTWGRQNAPKRKNSTSGCRPWLTNVCCVNSLNMTHANSEKKSECSYLHHSRIYGLARWSWFIHLFVYFGGGRGPVLALTSVTVYPPPPNEECQLMQGNLLLQDFSLLDDLGLI